MTHSPPPTDRGSTIDLRSEALRLGEAARRAAPLLGRTDGRSRDAALTAIAWRLRQAAAELLAANAADLEAGRQAGLDAALIDRLSLDEKRVERMTLGVEAIRALPDPLGKVLDGWTQPSGLRLSRVRVPLGVVLIIFESRPNVTVDAAALCIKSGNATILRGGKEAQRTNAALGEIVGFGLADAGLPIAAAQVVGATDRGLVEELLRLDRHIDVVVPRGGKGLIRAVMEHSRLPVIKHLDGICHIFVDAAADLEMARRIVVNAKAQRPGTCNALETLLVHRAIAGRFLPSCLAELQAAGVEVRGDGLTRMLAPGAAVIPASDEDWDTEYLSLVLSVAVVPDLDAAIAHIERHGSHHTDAIVTGDLAAANRFKREVDSASVMVNASTRLADGFEYGLGAEIGISTDKLHARGPVGLDGLTTYKWIVEGEGHLRE